MKEGDIAVAQIPIPPGLTLDGYISLLHEVVTVSIATVTAASIALWDYINLLPMELSLYSSMDKRMWRAPATVAFFVLRYSVFLALIPTFWFSILPNKHCQLSTSLSQTGVVLVTGSAGIIFSYRVFSIWKFNKLVIAFVSILYLLMIGCWIAVATNLGATEGPPALVGSNCIINPFPVWSPIGFASSVAFDSVVLLLTIIGLRGTQKTTNIGRLLLNDNIIYFVIVTATNLFVLVIQSLQSTDSVKPVVLPFPTLMTTAMGSRVYLNLRLFRSGMGNAEASIPLTSTSIPSAPRTTVQFSATRPKEYYTAYDNSENGSMVKSHVRMDTVDALGPGKAV